MKRFRTIAGAAIAGSIACGAMIGGAVADTYPVTEAAAPQPAIATSTVTITAMGQTDAERAATLGMRQGAASNQAPESYSYVVYFPVGEDSLTQPAQMMLSAVAEEVTEMELSNVTLTPNDGLLARAETVRDALVAMGVPARWIAVDEDGPAETGVGPVSMGLDMRAEPAAFRR